MSLKRELDLGENTGRQNNIHCLSILHTKYFFQKLQHKMNFKRIQYAMRKFNHTE